ncbi:electron transfer flavoprotein subunit alpha/FixB family protein [Alicyclobacillus cycloheptanicus]|uniref:Electron transfer flavoprotein alpha subunit n=1 Tax=Alicyclobacillus cycloheptanicus TaxID=1457 RepID=A0ABT9XLF6_9BACL|nr:electron transfer flavoprotein subunit alpha/FixB family protein [Alicyclobacillus cycloheptanicus]MDQ0190593.1 electron transfer flavoprotein alpha subunit [Alicyclobacillus cycloheptanicus]WDM01800.1 electron transfer flavoprotein subunit alpha/FixB family protein [Alicyclobacillus cycloheptanicus]
MAKNVLVLADVRNGKLRNVTFEMLAAANQIADGGQVAAVLLGSGVEGLAEGLGDAGADTVYVVDAPELEKYTPSAYRKAFLEAHNDFGSDVLLLAHSAVGKDLAPVVAMRLSAGQVSDIVGFDMEGGDIVFTRPIYAGKAFTKVKVTDGIVIATVRPNNLPAPESGFGKSGTVKKLAVSFEQADLTTVVKEIIKKTTTGVDLTEAKIIVSGGRGVKSADGFQPLRELADVLGAAVGASRGACDAGYCDYSMQIGQTGKVVTPDLYIACGISGAIQHLAGMSNSKVIVAINKDPEAPIFQVADYGIVGDLFEVVPMLTEEFKKVLATA